MVAAIGDGRAVMIGVDEDEDEDEDEESHGPLWHPVPQ